MPLQEPELTPMQKRVGAAIRVAGTAHVARLLEVSREALLSFAGDFPRQTGTDAVIAQHIDRLTGLVFTHPRGLPRRKNDTR